MNGNPIWWGYTGSTLYDDNGVMTQKYYANPALIGPGAVTLNHCRFAYANVAVRGFSVTVNHSHFVQCIQGISIVNSIGSSGYTSGYQATLNNSLLAHMTRCVGFDFASSGSSWPLTVKQCTVADTAEFVHSGGCTVSVNAMNSIFANVTSLAGGGSVGLSGCERRLKSAAGVARVTGLGTASCGTFNNLKDVRRYGKLE